MVIYIYKCGRVKCDEYIRDFSRTFGERFKEHLNVPSPVYEHYNTTVHTIIVEDFSIVGRDNRSLIRTIKEAIYIRVSNMSLNKYMGRYHLPHVWVEVMFNISELKINHPHVAIPSATYGNNFWHLQNTCGHSICHDGLPSATEIQQHEVTIHLLQNFKA